MQSRVPHFRIEMKNTARKELLSPPERHKKRKKTPDFTRGGNSNDITQGPFIRERKSTLQLLPSPTIPRAPLPTIPPAHSQPPLYVPPVHRPPTLPTLKIKIANFRVDLRLHASSPTLAHPHFQEEATVAEGHCSPDVVFIRESRFVLLAGSQASSTDLVFRREDVFLTHEC